MKSSDRCQWNCLTKGAPTLQWWVRGTWRKWNLTDSISAGSLPLGYWHHSAEGPISNTIIFHIPAKHTDLNVFISSFLSPPIMVHHSHWCIINNTSSVWMCMFVTQMEKGSTWSTAISIEDIFWGCGKNSQVCFTISVGPILLTATFLAGHAQYSWRTGWWGRRKGFTYWNTSLSKKWEAVSLRLLYEVCAVEWWFYPQNTAGKQKVDSFAQPKLSLGGYRAMSCSILVNWQRCQWDDIIPWFLTGEMGKLMFGGRAEQ